MQDYGHDVEKFNAEHRYQDGCRLGRMVGSDITECSTHGALVVHGVPALLRTIS